MNIQPVLAECFGSGDYQVCSDSYTDSSGNLQIRSWDTQGNSYSVNSESYSSPSGGTTVRSYDSEGNSYSVRSWSDSGGVHSEDSAGNRYTITRSGEVIQTKNYISKNKIKKKAKKRRKNNHLKYHAEQTTKSKD